MANRALAYRERKGGRLRAVTGIREEGPLTVSTPSGATGLGSDIWRLATIPDSGTPRLEAIRA
ncbi:hypothetical protein [Acidiferrobacter sp.]|uniref:hypothetical protein n=1 Tax=Acidiferrobacter sp. TaxID=1872107 RepID=UPI0026376AD2|nr:hypothetical protein [Acidiferrobacter sp.]